MRLFKKQIIILSLIAVIVSVSNYSQGEPSKTDPEKKWFKLFPGDIHVEDFALKAEESREFELPSNEPLTIGLMTDASFDLKKGSKYVRLMQKGTQNWVATLIGASRLFTPEKGKIILIVKNETDADLRVVIFKTPKK